MPENNRYIKPTLAFIFISGIYYITNVLERHQSFDLGLSFFATFFIYAWIARFESKSLNFIFWIGIIARLSTLISLPSLSDDFYRFLWDGELLHNGTNPYSFLPTDIDELSSFQQYLLPKLNSPSYFSVYPPSNQLIFYIATAFEGSILFQVNIIRFFLLIAELLAFKLVVSLTSENQKIAWIFLNPLLIVEGIGNLHFEVFIVLFMMASIYFIKEKKWSLSGLSLGLAASTKLLPLIYFPFLLMRFFWKRGLIITFIAGATAAVSLIPFFSTTFDTGILSSISLYFKKFEFNASVYYLLREIGYYQYGYNTIGTLGPGLAAVSGLLLIIFSFVRGIKERSIVETFMFLLTLYLLMSTTVHPWYILPLLIFGILSGYYYTILWSLLIIISYFGYSTDGYHLSPNWLIMEYLLVIGLMIAEIWLKYANSKTTNTIDDYGRSE